MLSKIYVDIEKMFKEKSDLRLDIYYDEYHHEYDENDNR